MKKVVSLIFPMLAVIGLLIGLLDYWGIKEIGNYQEKQLASLNQRITEAEETLRIKEKLKTLGETTSAPYDDLIREYKRDNENLKQSTLKFSPSGKKQAYFQHKFTTNIEEIGDEDYTSVVVNHDGKEETAFQGNYRLSYFEWLNDEEIVVYRGCGTECMIAYIVDLKTKTPQEFTLGVGYTWAPNKKYVLAYHHSYQYGISISDKGDLYGRTIFQLRRNHPPSGSGLTNKTQASWSPDSSKIALIIKKENEETLELLVFNVEGNFKLLMQKDLENNEFSDLGWKDAKTVFYEVNGRILELTVLP